VSFLPNRLLHYINLRTSLSEIMTFIRRVEKNPPSLKVEDSLIPVLLYTILSPSFWVIQVFN